MSDAERERMMDDEKSVNAAVTAADSSGGSDLPLETQNQGAEDDAAATSKRKADDIEADNKDDRDTSEDPPRKKQKSAENEDAEDDAKDDGDEEKMKESNDPTNAEKEATEYDNMEKENVGLENPSSESEEKNNEKGDEECAYKEGATANNSFGEREDNTQQQQPPEQGSIDTSELETDFDKKRAATKAQEDNVNPDSPKGNPYESLKYTMVENDGTPENLIKLVALKSLFSKQLPKMPRAYIARLVFDRRHVSLAILNENPATKDTDEEVIGAICYRPFYDMRFAEIAFCAVNASHQVKGYGTKLMNLVKQQGARTGIEYFITYADNYAIGYFKKQGFSKSIAMPKGRYQGLIKDYDGGTMMECYVHPSIDFTRIPEMLSAQREFILSRIRLKAQSTKVYPPLLKDWSPSLEGVSRGNEAAARALAIPGMVEAGWTMADLLSATGQGKDLDRAKNVLKSEMLGIVRKVEEQQFAWPFRDPVDTAEVKDYLEIIKEPIDLSTIDKRIRKGDHYKSKKMLYADMMLMVNNCKLYNEEGSTYMQCARNLETYLKALFANL